MNRGNTTIVLIACSARKRSLPAPAKDLYQGTLFQAARTWAEKRAERWFILSAKHYLLHPDRVISPYDQSLARWPIRARRAWGTQIAQFLRSIADEIDLLG